MYSVEMIRDALKEGTKRGSRLFPELHETSVRDRIGGHPDSSRLVAELLGMAGQIGSLPPEPISYSIFTEYSRTGARETYDRLLTKRLNDLAVLGMAALVDGSGPWIEAVQERLWEFCNLYIWELTAVVSLDAASFGEGRPEPRENVGLLAAESAFQLMEMVYALGDRLDPFLVYRVRKEVAERVIQPYARHRFWWKATSTNWQSVCSASIGSAALYAIEDEAELSLLLEPVIRGLQLYLAGFDREGVTTEGLDYWSYGFASFVFFAELLHERTAGRFRLLDLPQVKAIAAFPQVVMLSEGSVVNFSDCSERTRMPGYLAARLGRMFGLSYGLTSEERVRMPAANMARWAYLSRSLFWTAEEAGNVRQPEGLTSWKEAQWLVDKRMVGSGRLLAFAAKGGHNDEPHNHNDLGHFILHVAGKNVMPDLGAPEYTRATFSAERYEHLLTSSRGHSVPVINGKNQSPGRDRFASVMDSLDDGRAVRFKLELSRAYEAPELAGYVREWEWDYSSCTLSVRDEFRFTDEGNEIEHVYVFRDEPCLLRPGTLQVNAGVCRLEASFPETAKVRIFKETYRVRTGEEASAYVVRLGQNCRGYIASFELFIRIIMK